VAPQGLIVFDTHLDLSESLDGDRLTRASPIRRICELESVDPRRVAIVGARGSRNLREWQPAAEELGIAIFPIGEVESRGIAAVTADALAVAAPDGGRPY